MHPWFEHDKKNTAAILAAVSEASAQYIQQQENKAPFKPAPSLTLGSLPAEGVGTEKVLHHFHEHVAPLLGNSAGPRYFGFVTGGSTPASVAGDWLVSTFDNNLSHFSGGAGGFIERQTISYLKDLFGLDAAYSGTFVTGATMSNLVGLAIGRQWIGKQLGFDISETGLSEAPPITVLSATPHSSVIKSLSMLGMGRKAMVKIPTLPGHEAIDIAALEDRLWESGPVIVVANAGTVNTVDFDDLRAIAKLKEKHTFWLHVDAAFGGFAACSEKYAHLMEGINAADSITIDAHKWLNVPYDSAVQFTRHPELQVSVFMNHAPYLGDASISPDYLHYTPENSRRFRALPAWFSLLAYGKAGYRELVERNCSLAAELGERIRASETFTLLAPVNMNVVCFTLNMPALEQQHIDAFLRMLHATEAVFLTPTVYKGTPAIRIALSNWQTTHEHTRMAWNAMLQAAGQLHALA
jgi:glutamate/tyrosine decarboxylase-like PLP-dependent enzyme